MSNRLPRLNVPIYFDESGIAGLYAQTVDRLEEELTRSSGTQRQKKGLLRLGLGGLVGKLIGGAEVEGEVSTLRESMEQARLTMAAEHKLRNLEAYLAANDDEPFFDNLSLAIAHCHGGDKAFIRVSQRFDAPQFAQGQGGREVDHDGSLLFETSVQEQGDEEGMAQVVMSAGLANCTHARDGKFGMLSHTAIIFRELGGQAIPLELFGYLIPIVDLKFQIKPFAIWY